MSRTICFAFSALFIPVSSARESQAQDSLDWRSCNIRCRRIGGSSKKRTNTEISCRALAVVPLSSGQDEPVSPRSPVWSPSREHGPREFEDCRGGLAGIWVATDLPAWHHATRIGESSPALRPDVPCSRSFDGAASPADTRAHSNR